MSQTLVQNIAKREPLRAVFRDSSFASDDARINAEHGIAIVPQGGNTGLVGGQIPSGEVLISLRKMRAVRDVTPLDDAMTVEAGVTLLEALGGNPGHTGVDFQEAWEVERLAQAARQSAQEERWVRL